MEGQFEGREDVGSKHGEGFTESAKHVIFPRPPPPLPPLPLLLVFLLPSHLKDRGEGEAYEAVAHDTPEGAVGLRFRHT